MRCQRVRSYLSAYCKQELTGRRLRAVREHLDGCPECRREEALINEISGATAGLPRYSVSSDFNSKLLNRIARERFQETRTKAYIPKRIPLFGWAKLIPAVASITMVIALVFYGGLGGLNTPPDQGVIIADNTDDGDGLDDRYKYVQPESNHVLNQHVNSEWAFKKQVARASRIRALMNSLASQTDFKRDNIQFATSQNFPMNQGFFIRLPLDGMTMNRAYNLVPAVENASSSR
nr:zf-HC2 domain-containing protein [candidate division Zixibacteria bacterium]